MYAKQPQGPDEPAVRQRPLPRTWRSTTASCNEPSFLDGLENMRGRREGAGRLPRPDAIQMNYGQADLLQDIPGKDKPALVMRIDMGNPYNRIRHRDMWAVSAERSRSR